MVESPWDQVPLDVVSEILQWACYVPPVSSSYSSRHQIFGTKGILSPGAMQWSLSRVCRDWRRLVLSDPALWSELQVHVHARLGPRYVFGLELVLTRSGNHLLDVEIIAHDCDGNEASKPVESSTTRNQIIMRLFAESHRWRSAELNFHGIQPERIVNLLQGRLPRLESLVLAIIPRCAIAYTYQVSTIRAFADCPNLRVVDIPIPCTPDIQWNQIISYRSTPQAGTFMGPGWLLDSYLTNVGACQALESLSFLGTEFSPLRSVSYGSLMVTNGSLRRLEVACAIVLDHLILPALTDVKLHFRNSAPWPTHHDAVFASLEKLLLRSNCARKITRLTLVNVFITSDVFLSATAHMANLEVLHVDKATPMSKVHHNTNTLKKLFSNLNNREKVWLPRLRDFSFSVMNDGSFPFITSDVELVRLLQFRWKGSTDPAMAKLHNFMLVQHNKNSWNPSKSIRRDLQALADDGMILTVQVSAEPDGIIVGS